jgi:hypothetical protein
LLPPNILPGEVQSGMMRAQLRATGVQSAPSSECCAERCAEHVRAPGCAGRVWQRCNNSWRSSGATVQCVHEQGTSLPRILPPPLPFVCLAIPSFLSLSLVRALSRIHVHALANAHAHAHTQKRERRYAENPDSPEAIADARMREEVRNRANLPKRTIGGPLGKRTGGKSGGGGMEEVEERRREVFKAKSDE